MRGQTPSPRCPRLCPTLSLPTRHVRPEKRREEQVKQARGHEHSEAHVAQEVPAHLNAVVGHDGDIDASDADARPVKHLGAMPHDADDDG